MNFTDSVTVQAKKFTNKVAIETGSPCNPTIQESEEGRIGGSFSILWPSQEVGAYLSMGTYSMKFSNNVEENIPLVNLLKWNHSTHAFGTKYY